jgi:ribosomal protein S21
LRIEALERKLQVLHAFVESHDFALRDFKKEVRDEKRFEQLFSLNNET